MTRFVKQEEGTWVPGNVRVVVTSKIPDLFLGMSRLKLTKPSLDRSSNQQVQSHSRVVEDHETSGTLLSTQVKETDILSFSVPRV